MLAEAIQFGFDTRRCLSVKFVSTVYSKGAVDRMNQFSVEDQFNCSFGCENPNQCEYYNNLPPTQVIPQLQNYVENGNLVFNNVFDDSVVPPNHYENGTQQMPSYQNYPNPMQSTAYLDQCANQNVAFAGGSHFNDTSQNYAPCQGTPWNFAHCYGYYGEAPCQYADVVDMEDFM